MIYATAGVGAHQIRKSGTDFSLYSGIVGLGFESVTSDGAGIGFSANYEQSFRAEDYGGKGVKFRNVELSSFEYALTLSKSI